MFGVSSNPKCLNVKSGNPCEPVRFADSPQPAPQSPHKNRGSYMPGGGGGVVTGWLGTCHIPGHQALVGAEAKGWSPAVQISRPRSPFMKADTKSCLKKKKDK